MSGINLSEMDASDMLDVLHFYFEQETAFISAEQAGELTRIRKRLYENLYERPYKYGQAASDAEFQAKVLGTRADGNFSDESEDEEDEFLGLMPFDPARPKEEHKPFVPTTDFDPDSEDPFNGILDTPLSH